MPRRLIDRSVKLNLANPKDLADIAGAGRHGAGSGRVRGTGLKGIVTWKIPPIVLAEAVDEAGVRLIGNVDKAMTDHAKIIRDQARALAGQQYVTQTPRAAPGLSTSRESPGAFGGAGRTKGTFSIYLFHGPRTIHNEKYYGVYLEANANQYGQFGHVTEVILPTIINYGPDVIRAMEGALVRSLGSSGAVMGHLRDREALAQVRAFRANKRL